MRVPLYFRFGDCLKKKPATTVGQSWPSRAKKKPLPLARRKKKPLPLARRKGLPLATRGKHEATRGKHRAVQSRKGVARTATEVIAPAGAARGSRKRGPSCRSLTKLGSKSVDCPRAFSGADSDAQHFAEHAPCNKAFCIRCDFHRRRQTYTARSLLPNGSSWLAAGEHRGLWGLGCRVCAKAAAAGRKSSEGRFSKFATFQVRPSSGFHARFQVEQHQRSAAHRLVAGVKRFMICREEFSPQPLPLACDAASFAAPFDCSFAALQCAAPYASLKDWVAPAVRPPRAVSPLRAFQETGRASRRAEPSSPSLPRRPAAPSRASPTETAAQPKQGSCGTCASAGLLLSSF